MELMTRAESQRGDLTDDIASCTNTTDEPQRMALMAADR